MSSKMAAVQYVIPKVPDGSLCKNTVFILHHIRHITTFQRPFSLFTTDTITRLHVRFSDSFVSIF